MGDVFISYKQEERAAVEIVASALTDLKLDVWFDKELRAGSNFDESIAAALNNAKSVLVCWTPAAIESQWVRGEASSGLADGRLVACFLEPTKLIPPFNVIQTENLAQWAGQVDDPAWLKLLEKIGELVGRPGIATYHAAMRANASLQELKAWAASNPTDPLVGEVIGRIARLEGEDVAARSTREQAELRAAANMRRRQMQASRRLAHERGIRDPVRERRRWLALIGAFGVLALLFVGSFFYLQDAQARERALDNAADIADVRVFLERNAWHPVATLARAKFLALDAQAWERARSDGSIAALGEYLAAADGDPGGAFVVQAQSALRSAERTRRAQEMLRRLLLYHGPLSGANGEATLRAVRIFRYRINMPISNEIDDGLILRLEEALEVWTHPRLEDLRASNIYPPTEQEIIDLAAQVEVEPAVVLAIGRVESGNYDAFQNDDRPVILFERHVFARVTDGRFNASHPRISNPQRGGQASSQGQRWRQVALAFALDQDAALQATSIGRFGTPVSRYRDYGFVTPGEFARFLSQSETNQYESFIRFAIAQNLVQAMRDKDWSAISNRYHENSDLAGTYAARYADEYETIVDGLSMQVALAPLTEDHPYLERTEIDVPILGEADNRLALFVLMLLALAGVGIFWRWREASFRTERA